MAIWGPNQDGRYPRKHADYIADKATLLRENCCHRKDLLFRLGYCISCCAPIFFRVYQSWSLAHLSLILCLHVAEARKITYNLRSHLSWWVQLYWFLCLLPSGNATDPFPRLFVTAVLSHQIIFLRPAFVRREGVTRSEFAASQQFSGGRR